MVSLKIGPGASRAVDSRSDLAEIIGIFQKFVSACKCCSPYTYTQTLSVGLPFPRLIYFSLNYIYK